MEVLPTEGLSFLIELIKRINMKPTLLFNIKSFLATGFILFCGHVQSQKMNTMTIYQPVEIAGDYSIAQAEWGDTTHQTFSAPAVFATPVLGCEPFINDYTNKVVFMERGTCAYDRKAFEAQKAGAIAVVICNNTKESLFLLAPDSLAPHINIPVFLTTSETCKKLEIELSGVGIQGLFHYSCQKPVYTSNVVWGDKPGEGDFKNGFSGWTTDKGWTYNAEGIIRKGGYTGTPRVVGAATACDGVAEFNSDHLDNNSQPGGLTGSCPAPCTGYLLSPVIQLNKPLENGLVLEFSQSLRQFQSQYFIIVSKDGGTTWTDTIKINSAYTLNSSHISERIQFPIHGVEENTSLQIKFVCIGNYFYWAIDDVILLDKKFVDLILERGDCSVSPYYKSPFNQVSEIPLMVKINAMSNQNAENINLNFTIEGPDKTYSFNKSFPKLQSGYNEKLYLMDTNFISPTQIGLYKGEYTISCDDEAFSNNNSSGFQWRVSEKTFGNLESEQDYGSPYLNHHNPLWLAIAQTRNKTFGNIYFIPYGKGHEAIKARFGIGEKIDNVKGQGVRIDLFELNDVNQDHYLHPHERKKIGGGFVILNDSIVNLRNIETDIWAIDQNGHLKPGERVPLKDHQHYLLCGTTTVLDSATFKEFYLLHYATRKNDNYGNSISNAAMTVKALDSLAYNGKISFRSVGSVMNMIPDFETNDNIDNVKFSSIFSYFTRIKVFMELDISQVVSSQFHEKKDILKINLFPNPAARELFIDLALNNVSQYVDIYMYDVEGKLVSVKNLNNIKESRIKLDVSTFANGFYNVRIVTAEGVATRKVVIQN